MPRLALFDMDNTLVDRAAGFRLWAEEFRAQRGLTADDVEWMVKADGDGFVPKEIYFSELRERFGLADTVDDLWAEHRDRHATLIPLCPGVVDGLATLRAARWAVGVVTNGYDDMQHATIAATGLAEHVDGYAVSETENTRKPDTRLFEIAANRCGTTLTPNGWMTGDSPGSDIAGGRAAGLRTIWLTRNRTWPGGDEPDHSVDTVASAITLLLTLGADEA